MASPYSNPDADAFWAYTNKNFANNRGISFITIPSVAASIPDTDPLRTEANNPPLPYEPRYVPGRGIGLYANQSRSPGQEIMAFPPVLVIMREALKRLSRDARHAIQRRVLSQFPESTRKLFFDLARSRGGDEIDDIIQTNAIGMRYAGNIGHLVVVPEAARINHACRPNAYYRFNETTLHLEVFALRPITPGEEITISYGYSEQPHHLRRKNLHQHWSFNCTCTHCNSFEASEAGATPTSDARLTRIAEIKSLLPSILRDTAKIIESVTELVQLYKSEDLFVEIPRYEEILAYAWAQLGHEEEVKRWAGRAKEGWEILAGKESGEAMRMESFIWNVRQHPSWRGTRNTKG